MLKRLILIFSIAICVGLISVDSFSAPNQAPQKTESGDGNQKTEGHGTGQIPSTFDGIFHWLGNRSDGQITASATIVIAIFTIVLGIGTVCMVMDGRTHSERELRAYVQIHNIEAAYEVIKDARPRIRVFVHWQNTGQTPTRHLKWAVDHYLGAAPPDFAFDLSDRHSRGVTTIGAGGITRDVSHEIDRTGLESFDRSKECVTVFGAVEYSDIFPRTKRRRTEFCIEIRRENGVTIQNYTADRHNGADEECLKPAGSLDA